MNLVPLCGDVIMDRIDNRFVPSTLSAQILDVFRAPEVFIPSPEHKLKFSLSMAAIKFHSMWEKGYQVGFVSQYPVPKLECKKKYRNSGSLSRRTLRIDSPSMVDLDWGSTRDTTFCLPACLCFFSETMLLHLLPQLPECRHCCGLIGIYTYTFFIDPLCPAS